MCFLWFQLHPFISNALVFPKRIPIRSTQVDEPIKIGDKFHLHFSSECGSSFILHINLIANSNIFFILEKLIMIVVDIISMIIIHIYIRLVCIRAGWITIGGDGRSLFKRLAGLEQSRCACHLANALSFAVRPNVKHPD